MQNDPRVGLIGYPIEHSLSPCLHNAAYQELQLPWEYQMYPCPTPDDFSDLIANVYSGAKDLDQLVAGFNVTMPYKQAAAALCDTLDMAATVSGGANVLSFLDVDDTVAVWGHSTDGKGIVRSLECEGGVDIPRARVVICGTGSTAAAALVALLQEGAPEITVVSRDVRRARSLIADVDRRFREAGVDTASQGICAAVEYGEVSAILAGADVLIDATPLGMHAQDAAVVPLESIEARHVVFDVVYGQREATALLRGAMEQGARAIDGLGMLVEQAALTVEIWARLCGYDITAPRTVMRRAAEDELVRRTVASEDV